MTNRFDGDKTLEQHELERLQTAFETANTQRELDSAYINQVNSALNGVKTEMLGLSQEWHFNDSVSERISQDAALKNAISNAKNYLVKEKAFQPKLSQMKTRGEVEVIQNLVTACLNEIIKDKDKKDMRTRLANGYIQAYHGSYDGYYGLNTISALGLIAKYLSGSNIDNNAKHKFVGNFNGKLTGDLIQRMQAFCDTKMDIVEDPKAETLKLKNEAVKEKGQTVELGTVGNIKENGEVKINIGGQDLVFKKKGNTYICLANNANNCPVENGSLNGDLEITADGIIKYTQNGEVPTDRVDPFDFTVTLPNGTKGTKKLSIGEKAQVEVEKNAPTITVLNEKISEKEADEKGVKIAQLMNVGEGTIAITLPGHENKFQAVFENGFVVVKPIPANTVGFEKDKTYDFKFRIYKNTSQLTIGGKVDWTSKVTVVETVETDPTQKKLENKDNYKPTPKEVTVEKNPDGSYKATVKDAQDNAYTLDFDKDGFLKTPKVTDTNGNTINVTQTGDTINFTPESVEMSELKKKILEHINSTYGLTGVNEISVGENFALDVIQYTPASKEAIVKIKIDGTTNETLDVVFAVEQGKRRTGNDVSVFEDYMEVGLNPKKSNLYDAAEPYTVYKLTTADKADGKRNLEVKIDPEATKNRLAKALDKITTLQAPAEEEVLFKNSETKLGNVKVEEKDDGSFIATKEILKVDEKSGQTFSVGKIEFDQKGKMTNSEAEYSPFVVPDVDKESNPYNMKLKDVKIAGNALVIGSTDRGKEIIKHIKNVKDEIQKMKVTQDTSSHVGAKQPFNTHYTSPISDPNLYGNYTFEIASKPVKRDLTLRYTGTDLYSDETRKDFKLVNIPHFAGEETVRVKHIKIEGMKTEDAYYDISLKEVEGQDRLGVHYELLKGKIEDFDMHLDIEGLHVPFEYTKQDEDGLVLQTKKAQEIGKIPSLSYDKEKNKWTMDEKLIKEETTKGSLFDRSLMPQNRQQDPNLKGFDEDFFKTVFDTEDHDFKGIQMINPDTGKIKYYDGANLKNGAKTLELKENKNATKEINERMELINAFIKTVQRINSTRIYHPSVEDGVPKYLLIEEALSEKNPKFGLLDAAFLKDQLKDSPLIDKKSFKKAELERKLTVTISGENTPNAESQRENYLFKFDESGDLQPGYKFIKMGENAVKVSYEGRENPPAITLEPTDKKRHKRKAKDIVEGEEEVTGEEGNEENSKTPANEQKRDQLDKPNNSSNQGNLEQQNREKLQNAYNDKIKILKNGVDTFVKSQFDGDQHIKLYTELLDLEKKPEITAAQKTEVTTLKNKLQEFENFITKALINGRTARDLYYDGDPDNALAILRELQTQFPSYIQNNNTIKTYFNNFEQNHLMPLQNWVNVLVPNTKYVEKINGSEASKIKDQYRIYSLENNPNRPSDAYVQFESMITLFAPLPDHVSEQERADGKQDKESYLNTMIQQLEFHPNEQEKKELAKKLLDQIRDNPLFDLQTKKLEQMIAAE